MGLFRRIHRITVGRVSAFLDRVEDPEIVFPQLLREMEQQLQQATGQEARATAAVTQVEVKIDRLRRKVEAMGRGAFQALKQDREDVAREALGAQIDTEHEIERFEASLASLKASRNLAEASRKQIQQQLEQLRARKHALITRSRLARTRRRIQRSLNGATVSGGSILDAVARMEEHIESIEAEMEVQCRLTGEGVLNPALELSLAELDQAGQIDERLADLKVRLKGPGKTAPLDLAPQTVQWGH
ncbi:MAG: PspA/IM30 family protein [Planctomycetes bacterium]|nr:PspA/IM30 family protein [Planctomycetota bacterium]